MNSKSDVEAYLDTWRSLDTACCLSHTDVTTMDHSDQ